MSERKAVIPGEVIVKGNDYLPGDWTEKSGDEIVALRYGLVEESNRLIKIIPLSGVYQPRMGNIVIGKVKDITFNGWLVEIDASENGFLSVAEVPRYINKNALEEEMDIGDILTAKIVGINKRGIDLTVKSRNLGKIEDGIILKVNSNKVPRVIGKEGSMVKIIKEETNTNITVGQNGFIWIKGDRVEDELLAKKAILYIAEKSFIEGLTDEIKEWFKKEKNE
jgi:exosome complex component RRP4